jgi:hypothetical protein
MRCELGLHTSDCDRVDGIQVGKGCPVQVEVAMSQRREGVVEEISLG